MSTLFHTGAKCTERVLTLSEPDEDSDTQYWSQTSTGDSDSDSSSVVVAVTTAAEANYSSLIIENLVEIMEIDSHVNQHNVQQH